MNYEKYSKYFLFQLTQQTFECFIYCNLISCCNSFSYFSHKLFEFFCLINYTDSARFSFNKLNLLSSILNQTSTSEAYTKVLYWQSKTDYIISQEKFLQTNIKLNVFQICFVNGNNLKTPFKFNHKENVTRFFTVCVSN